MTYQLQLDHLVVSARSLDEGSAHVEAALGLSMEAGGVHEYMGTHNRLLSLGAGVYLEVIAIDPAAPRPKHPRWFNLDAFDGPPQLTHWACRTDDLDRALADAPAGSGTPVALSRGDFRWRFAVTDTGKLPFDEAMPALLEWQGDLHPTARLSGGGARFSALSVMHPTPGDLLRAMPALGDLADVTFDQRPSVGLAATIMTPDGPKVLV